MLGHYWPFCSRIVVKVKEWEDPSTRVPLLCQKVNKFKIFLVHSILQNRRQEILINYSLFRQDRECQKTVIIGPLLAIIGHYWAIIGCIWPHLGCIWPHFAQIWLNLAQLWLKLVKYGSI